MMAVLLLVLLLSVPRLALADEARPEPPRRVEPAAGKPASPEEALKKKFTALAGEVALKEATLEAPSERRLLFMTKGSLASVGLDGKDLRKLPIEGRVIHFEAAPTMDRLLYVTYETREVRVEGEGPYKEPLFKLFVSDLDGAAPKLITDQVGDPAVEPVPGVAEAMPAPLFEQCGGPAYPHWAADGRRILYAGWRDKDGSFPLVVADIVDGSQKLLLRIPGPTQVYGLEPPLEDQVVKDPFTLRAYQDRPVQGGRGLNLQLDPEGGARVGAAPRGPKRPLLTVWYCSDLRWHPDGRSITWSSDSTPEFQRVWVRDLEKLDPADRKAVTSGGTPLQFGEQFLWAPNGQQVAVIRRFQEKDKGIGHQVLLVEREGGKARELYREEPTQKVPATIRLLAWSPDSAKLAVFINSATRSRIVRVIEVGAPPGTAPVDIAGVVFNLPARGSELGVIRKSGFSPDGKTFFYLNNTLQGRRVVSSRIESIPLEAAPAAPGQKPDASAAALPPSAQPAAPGTSAGAPSAAPLSVIFEQAESIHAMAVVSPSATELPVPELPLVIPAASLEGTLKDVLVEKKAEVRQELRAAKDLEAQRKAPGPGEPVDTFQLLAKWFQGTQGILEAERKAREAAEAFFKMLAGAYNRMTPAERTAVERGLAARAFALRRYRTVQRGIVREKAGLGTMTSAAEIDAYYTALARATWAAQELEALVRMWGPINTARVLIDGSYDVYELSDPQPDPRRVAAVEKAQRRHFEALVETGIAAVLASEAQHEALTDARKARLYGFKEWWKDTKKDWNDPVEERGQRGLKIQILSLGLNVFDLMAGMGADAIKGGLYYVFGAEFHTRAEKIEHMTMEEWDRTLRKLVLLRLLKQRSLPEVRALAQAVVQDPLLVEPRSLPELCAPAGQSARAAAAPTLAIAPGKIDACDIRLLTEDRTVHEATDGGLLRIISVALPDFKSRARMELIIARDRERLVRRDMLAAYRIEQGGDPETGETTWGTILSPTAWADIISKNVADWDGFTQRKAQIDAKEQRLAAMEGLLDPLAAADFAFEELPEPSLRVHLELLTRSAPYTGFSVRVDEERTARMLHAWRKGIRDLSGDPDAAARVAFVQGLIATSAQALRAGETRRMLDLTYEDLIYAWDLPGALALAEGLQEDPTYAARARLLRDAIATDSVKQRGVAIFRNVGDIGFMGAAFGLAGRLAGTVAGWGAEAGAAEAAAGVADAGLPAVEAAAPGGASYVAAHTINFARYVYGAFNPLVHGARTVITQSTIEVLVEAGLPVVGQKYEALLQQLVYALDAATTPWLSGKVRSVRERAKKAIEAERLRYADLDAKAYAAEVLNRSLLRAVEGMLSFQERLDRAKDPVVRESVERQSGEAKQMTRLWLTVEWLGEQARRFQESLAKALDDPATLKRFVDLQRMLKGRVRPPTIEYYERVLRENPRALFDPVMGLDIETLRVEFKDLRKRTRPEDQGRLKTVEEGIDRERHARFLAAMGEFLARHSGQIEGVILNGTAPGNPEYKGIFSDKDFTILIRADTNPETIRAGTNAAFEKHGIVLNARGRPPSADIEAMIQAFLPGEVREISTWKDFEQWALVLSNDPTRYLSAGGAEWVGLYNYLNGGTLSAGGAGAVVDAQPNGKLLPRPPMHPMLAHGLVLDNARFDKLQGVSSIGETRTLAELLGSRAKYVLRCVDALIWAKAPKLLDARTPQGAQEKGYHGLLVGEAQQLTRGTPPLLSPEEFRTVQILADLKGGKTIFQALGIDPKAADASRARLEEVWTRMDALMRRAYGETREVYLHWLERFADAQGGDPKRAELLFTVAFRNWNAARRVNDAAHPDKLALLTGQAGGDPLARIKQVDMEVIGLGSRLDALPPRLAAMAAEPPSGPARPDAPGAATPSEPRASTRDPRGGGTEPGQAGGATEPGPAGAGPDVAAALPPEANRRHFGDEARPAEGADPAALPTRSLTVEPPPPPPLFRLDQIFEPADFLRCVFARDGFAYVRDERVGFFKVPLDNPHEVLNEVAAAGLARRVGANVPYTELLPPDPAAKNGAPKAVLRFVPGEELSDVLRGENLSGKPVAPPAGLTREQLIERVREQFIRDRLLSAILGDYDRKGNNYLVTPDGNLAAIDHANAEPIDANLSPESVAERMRKRFAGEDYPREGSTTTRYRDLDRQLGVTWAAIVKAWKEMKARLSDAKGDLDEKALGDLADRYGAERAQVLATWKARIEAMEGVLGTVFGAELRAKYDLKPRDDTGQPILFGQRGVSPAFSSKGRFKGADIDAVVAKLKSGELVPDDLPVEYVWVNGDKVVVNNRSLTALSKAGLKPTKMRDMTGRLPKDGPDSLESVLTRLEEMDGKPSRSIPIRAGDGWNAPARETVTLPE